MFNSCYVALSLDVTLILRKSKQDTTAKAADVVCCNKATGYLLKCREKGQMGREEGRET